MRTRFETALRSTLEPEGLHVFDVRLSRRPPEVSAELQDFWGGYLLDFKLATTERVRTIGTDMEKLRKQAEVVGLHQSRTFTVDLSCHEYCEPRTQCELDAYTIYVYTPEMLVCEKLRAICQQMPEYREAVKGGAARPRANDFFDIWCLAGHFRLELGTQANRELCRRMFDAKRVPLSLLRHIAEYRDFHRQGFRIVEDTVKPGVILKPFDYYFDYVLALVEGLHALGVE